MTLYSISVLARGLATDTDGKHRNDHAPQSCRGEEKKKTWHRALLKVIHRFTAHQAEKIYTPTEERDSNMFKPRQTHTRVYGHFFSHRPQAFRQWLWISPWEKVCVCLRLFFFHTKSHSNQYFNSNCMFGFFGGLWCLIIARFGRESQLQIYD